MTESTFAVSVLVDDDVVDTLETTRPTSFMMSWTRPPADASPLLRLPAPLRPAAGHVASWAEAAKNLAYGRFAPVASLPWARRAQASLAAHLSGQPRVQVAISHTDAEFWTPQLFGRRLLFPTAAQRMRGGTLGPSGRLTLRLGNPPPHTMTTPDGGLLGIVRSAEGDREVTAPSGVGYFVVALTFGPGMPTASASIISTAGGQPDLCSVRLVRPAWFEVVVAWCDTASRPSNSALEQAAADGRCSARSR